MQSKEDKIKEDLLAVFKNAQPVLSRNGLKEKALDYYKHNNFPGLRDEGWRQTNLTSLFKTTYQETHETIENINIENFLIPNLDADILVFINGFFSEALSRTKNDAIIITDIKLATEAYPEIFSRYFESTNILSENNFTALNTAFAHHGSFIHIAKNQTSGKPVHILNVNTAKTPVLTQIRNLVLVEKSAEIKIIETFHSVNKTVSFSNIVTELILEENAKADWVRLQMETNEANQINHMRVLQNNNSYFKSNCFTFSGKLIRNNISVNLVGEGSNCNLYGLYFPKNTQLFDNYTYINHAVPNCQSNQVYKGIIDDEASAVFYGKVLVSKDAQKTNAYQSNKNVLLSENAKINSKPQLEIYADDVACSHGSTTGQLDPESMFYLQSRGIPAAKARVLLLHGFVSEVIDKVTSEPIKEYINENINLLLENLEKK